MSRYAVIQKLSDLMATGYLVTHLTDKYVWVEYAGHVDKIEVRVAPKSDYKEKFFEAGLYMKNHETEEILVKLEEWNQKLKEYFDVPASV